MKILIKILLCALLASAQNSAFATKSNPQKALTTSDKQLLHAYQAMVQKATPAKRVAAQQKTVQNKQNKQSKVIKPKKVVRNHTNPRKPHHTANISATWVAKQQINKKYRWGGTNPATGFDCSGLTQYAYKRARVNLPRTAAAQYKSTKRVSIKQLQTGDLIFFHTRRSRARINHVGIYLGGGKFIHAPSRGKRVSVSDLNKYWRRKVVGAGRII